MFIKRKRTEVNLERFDGFHIQKTFDCDGILKTLFFQLQRPADKAFIEYMKPFGYPVSLPGNVIEVQRDKFFRLLISIGRDSFHAEFEPNGDPDAQKHLMNQVYRGVHRIIRKNILKSCPEDAVIINDGRFTVDLKKCTYCLECVY